LKSKRDAAKMPRVSGRALWSAPAFAAFLAGCFASPAVLRIDGEGARGVLVLSRASGTTARLEAIDLSGTDPYFTTPRIAPSETVDVLEYGCALSDLRIAPGLLMIEPGPAGSALPMPAARILAGNADPGARLDLVRSASASDAIAALRFVPEVPGPGCAAPQIDSVRLGGADRDLSMGVALGADAALFATREGHFYRAASSGIAPLTMLSTSTPHGAGFLSDASTLWLLGQDGRLIHGSASDLERASDRYSVSPSLPALSTSTAPRPIVLTGSRGGAPLELFALIAGSSLHRFDGSQWTMLAEGGVGGPSGLLWLGPDEVLAVGLRAEGVLHVRGATSEVEPLRSSPTAIASIRGTGVVAATIGGEVFVRTSSGAWTALPGSTLPSSVPPAAIAAFGAGFVVSDRWGRRAEYRPDLGFCPPGQDGRSLFAMIPLGDGLAVAGENAVGELAIHLLAPGVPRTNPSCARLADDPQPVPACRLLIDPIAGGPELIRRRVIESQGADRCTLTADGGGPLSVPCNDTSTVGAPLVGLHVWEVQTAGPCGSSECSATFWVEP
jgi:hypothetical protein